MGGFWLSLKSPNKKDLTMKYKFFWTVDTWSVNKVTES